MRPQLADKNPLRSYMTRVQDIDDSFVDPRHNTRMKI